MGPNYKSEPVCLQCLRMVTNGNTCSVCKYPVCSEECAAGPRHAAECRYLAENTAKAETIRSEEMSAAYAHVTILRMLLLMEAKDDGWILVLSNYRLHISEREGGALILNECKVSIEACTQA